MHLDLVGHGDQRLDAALRAVIAMASRVSAAATPLATTDQSDWVAAAAITAYGVRVGLRTDSPALLAELRARVPPGSRPTRSTVMHLLYAMRKYERETGRGERHAVYVGYAGETPFVETADRAAALAVFESIVQFDVAATSTRRVFVHAGVVAWKGGAIVLPARSMRGKSRLVDALVRAGASYYSDEFAVIDERGRVHAFRIPLSLRDGDGGVRRMSMTGPADATALTPLPIGVVVSTWHETGAVWGPRRGSSGESMMALLSNTVRARLAPGQTLKVLARAVHGAVMLEGPRGEADDVAPLLLEEIR